MSNSLKQQIIQLFGTFFPEHVERWVFLLEHDQVKWHKMAPHKHWFTIDKTECSPRKLDLSHPLLLGKENQVVVALSCGRDRHWIQELTLDEAYQSVREGYISISPGELGLAVNHEGGEWLLQTTGGTSP